MQLEGPTPHRGRKLIMQSDGEADSALHLFTEIPVSSFERNPVMPNKRQRDKNALKCPSLNSASSLTYAMPLDSDSSHRHSSRPLHRNPREKQSSGNNVLQRQRIRNLCRNVVRKLRMNNQYSPLVGEEELQRFEARETTSGWQMADSWRNWWDVVASLVMLLLFLSQTFLLVFPELLGSVQIWTLILAGTVVFAGEVVMNLVLVRRCKGRKVKALGEIAWSYLTGEFWVDVAFLLVLLLDWATWNGIFNELLVGLSVLKAGSLLRKLHRIQRWLFKTQYYERYWSLLKIMFFNLAFAHVIAIALNLMARVNPSQNWQMNRGISSAWWGERYIWSYYWATTIMLTVGFGDIVPSTYQEAVWVIVIEIVSCIAFSYNISCLGTLIASIRSQGELINRNRKVFENFAEKRNLPEALTEKVLHYIDESGQVKSRFSIVEERELIGQLPESYRTQVLAESNKTLLKSLPFFNQVLLRGVCELSKRLQRNVYFPEQTIRGARSQGHVYILEKGEVGFACRSPGSQLDRVYANIVKRTQKEGPFLLSTDFLGQSGSRYDIRARDYSIVHRLAFEDFKSTLAGFRKDYEYYCFLRDRAKVFLDEHETVPCDTCKQNHTRFICPRLHFIPLREHVVYRELHQRRLAKDHRTITFERMRWRRANTLTADRMGGREQARLIELRGESFQDLPRMPTLADFRAEGVLSELKTISVRSHKQKEEDNYGEVFKTIKMMELRQELKMKEELMNDEVWLLACDRGEDYAIFFPENNLKSIINRHRKALKGYLSH